MADSDKAMEEFDATVTPEEHAAPTFLEWSDSTIARGVRALAAKLHDSIGFGGITGMAAGLALEKIARDNNATEYNITIDGKTKISVRLMGSGEDELEKKNEQTG